MTTILRLLAPYLIGAGILAAAAGGVVWYGHTEHEAGVQEERARVERLQASITAAMQEEKDRAEAKYRGAVLARQAAEKDLSTARARLDRVLRDNANRAQASRTSVGSDDSGPDWIGVLGSCFAEYEWMGREAGRLADQVNGLQGYITSIRTAQP